jgi:hypothetical protein
MIICEGEVQGGIPKRAELGSVKRSIRVESPTAGIKVPRHWFLWR